MSNNVFQLPFDDLQEIDDSQVDKDSIMNFMGEVYDWSDKQGVDIQSINFKHQAAVIMTQLQVILMGKKQ